jgi:hypothetical protein
VSGDLFSRALEKKGVSGGWRRGRRRRRRP